MTKKNILYSFASVLLFLGILGSHALGSEKKELLNQNDDSTGENFYKALKKMANGGSSNDPTFRKVQLTYMVRQLEQSIASDDQEMQEMVGRYKKELLTIPDSVGQFFASAIAPSYKDLSNSTMETWYGGLFVGIGQRITRDLAEVLSKHIKDSANLAIGKVLDTFIGKVSVAWFQLTCLFLHGGHQPFDLRIVNGWHELIQNTFEDVGSLVKDGIRHGMRNLDMTSRQQENEDGDDSAATDIEKTKTPTAEPEKENLRKIVIWNVLISGYVRQFRYISNQIKWYCKYYWAEHPVVFYGNEICSRLEETALLLEQSKTLKELDSAIESNVGFISAVNKNISNLLKQLKQACEPLSEKSSSSTSSPIMSKKEKSSSLLSGDFDND